MFYKLSIQSASVSEVSSLLHVQQLATEMCLVLCRAE